MLEQRELAYEVFGFRANVVVATANTARGLKRSMLAEEGLREEIPDPVIKAFLWLQWPAYQAGTVNGDVSWLEPVSEIDAKARPVEAESEEEPLRWVSVSVSELTFEQFLEHVPEEFASEWMNAILELNGHWMIQSKQDKEAEANDPKKKKKSRRRKQS